MEKARGDPSFFNNEIYSSNIKEGTRILVYHNIIMLTKEKERALENGYLTIISIFTSFLRNINL